MIFQCRARNAGPRTTRSAVHKKGGFMQADVLFRILKGASWAVIALMLLSILYACITSIRYWSGIGV